MWRSCDLPAWVRCNSISFVYLYGHRGFPNALSVRTGPRRTPIMKLRRMIAAVGLAWLAMAIPAPGPGEEPAAPKKTPLDDYIAKADPTFSWKLVQTIPGDGYTTFVVDLKSQSWRSPPEVDRALWQHWLVIVKPDEVKHQTAYLRIGGGKNGDEAPTKPNPQTVLIAKTTDTVGPELSMEPNQQLT